MLQYTALHTIQQDRNSFTLKAGKMITCCSSGVCVKIYVTETNTYTHRLRYDAHTTRERTVITRYNMEKKTESSFASSTVCKIDNGELQQNNNNSTSNKNKLPSWPSASGSLSGMSQRQVSHGEGARVAMRAPPTFPAGESPHRYFLFLPSLLFPLPCSLPPTYLCLVLCLPPCLSRLVIQSDCLYIHVCRSASG